MAPRFVLVEHTGAPARADGKSESRASFAAGKLAITLDGGVGSVRPGDDWLVEVFKSGTQSVPAAKIIQPFAGCVDGQRVIEVGPGGEVFRPAGNTASTVSSASALAAASMISPMVTALLFFLLVFMRANAIGGEGGV